MRRQLAAALLGAALLTGGAQAVAEPTAARYVADEADVLSSETEQYIIDKNQSLFEDTGGEIVVVSVDFMDGMDAADYAMAVAESWGGIGDESLNNGFLLVYAVGENKVWAMAGSGIEDALPASKIEGWLEADFYGGYDARRIRQRHPRFFSTTCMAGMRAIMAHLRGLWSRLSPGATLSITLSRRMTMCSLWSDRWGCFC